MENDAETEKLKVILVVDDSVFVRTSVVFALQHDGYETLEANNGYEALDKCHQKKPDLILMDLAMPNMDGFKAVETIKAVTQFKDIPVIIITAHATKDHVIRGKIVGVSGFLVKPFNLDDLKSTVEKTLLAC